jgi:LemA protein
MAWQMVNALTIVGAALAVLVLGGVVASLASLYNRLVRVQERAKNAWADIDVLLKQRRDAIEKLVDTAEQSMEYEEGLLTDVVAAREQAMRADTPEEQAAAGETIRHALGQLQVRAEDHPQPQAVENLQSLQDEIARIEEQIADRREVYNEAATAQNQLIRSIPYVILARPMGFGRRELYEPPAAETADVDVDQMFSDAGPESPTAEN